jgi:uncharacterized protein YdaU (DUF1376 family)
MSAPTDKALRAAVIAWTKAEFRRIEYLLNQRYEAESDEWLERLGDCAVAADRLRDLGVRMLTEKPAKRGKR